ncbi:MAG: kelch repeat-containing protein [Myxococcota bacterium]
MMMRSFLFAVLLVTSCGVLQDAPPPSLGTFQVRFRWKAPKPSHDAGLFVFGRVEDRTDPMRPSVLRTAGPIPFNADNDPPRLQFRDVPNGEKRVVVVEYRQGNTDAAPVRFHGTSPPFTLGIGRHQVLVDVELVAQPNLLVPAETPAVRVVATGEDGFVSAPEVTVHLLTDTGVRVQLANALPDLDSAPSRVVNDLPVVDDGGTSWRRVDAWNLDEGAALPCAQDECPREVFVRFLDADGYPSDTFSAPVLLDVKDPRVLSASGSTPVLSGETLRYAVAWSEPLRATGTAESPVRLPVLRVFGDDGNPVPWSLTLVGSTLTSATWELSALTPEDGAYTFSVELTDRAGRTKVEPGDPVVVDTALPEVRNESVQGGTRVTVDDVVTVGFTASEPCRTPEVSLVIQGSEPVLLDLVGEVAPISPDEGATYTFQHRVLASDPLGLGELLVTLTDEAGNRGIPRSVGLVEVENMAPQVISATVAYGAGPGNPLVVPSAARAGSTVTVSVIANETLDASAPVTLTLQGPAPLVEDLRGVLDTNARAVVFSFQVPANPTDGDYFARVAWQDIAGNRATDVTFATPVVVDNTPPELTLDPDALLLVRRPQGSTVAEVVDGLTVPPGPYFALLGRADWTRPLLPAGAIMLSDGAPVMVRVWSSATREQLLGTALPDENGRFPVIPLQNVDSPAVYVTALDVAGNESAPQLVRHAEWMATPHVVGSRAPHVVTRLHHVEDDRVSPLREDVDPRLVAGQDDNVAQAEGRPLGAHRRALLGVPQFRWLHGAAFDVARNVLVIHGGSQIAVLQDTWELDPSFWRAPAITSGLGARTRHALVYDVARGRVVAFGGRDADTMVHNDLWEWDGLTWRERIAPGPAPTARLDHCLVYDSHRGTVLLFGGATGDTEGELDDLWSWDGEAWTALTPADALKPFARRPLACTFDHGRGRMVVYGALAGDYVYGETWEWDGTRWYLLTPTNNPPLRLRTTATYDDARGVTVLFGGFTPEVVSLNDTWTWDGTNWEAQSPSVAPQARAGASLTYDPLQERVLLYGGQAPDNDITFADTWVWDGTRWAETTLVGPEPPARVFSSMAYDPQRGETVLFAGYDGSILGDTWTWDGHRWAPRTNLSNTPPARLSGMLVTLAPPRGVLLFGGYAAQPFQDTWEWDGATWTPITVDTPPPPRGDHQLAYHASRDEVVLFGGIDNRNGFTFLNDTWVFHDDQWAQRFPEGEVPTARAAFGMAYDARRDRTVLYGGFYALGGPISDETWEWDGERWWRIQPEGETPGQLASHTLVYDTHRQLMVLSCGADTGRPYADTWTYDGTRWRREVSVGRALAFPRVAPASAFDSQRKRLVVFGGNQFPPSGDTWELDAVKREPAIQWDVALDEARVAWSDVESLTVSAACSGTTPGDQDGARLMGWVGHGTGDAPGWRELARAPTVSVDGGAAPSTPLSWSSTSADQARALISVRDARVTLQCRPRGDSGASADVATVSADTFTLRMRYTLSP